MRLWRQRIRGVTSENRPPQVEDLDESCGEEVEEIVEKTTDRNTGNTLVKN